MHNITYVSNIDDDHDDDTYTNDDVHDDFDGFADLYLIN